MTASPSSLDRVEAVIADKRISRWPTQWQEFVSQLAGEEREVVSACVVLLDARPYVDERAS